MANPFGVPSMSVQELAAKRDANDPFILLDVREARELEQASIEGAIHAPLSDLSARQFEALPAAVRDDKDAAVAVLCRSGGRSAQVTAWLRAEGWTNVINVDGGIDAYASEVDPTVWRG